MRRRPSGHDDCDSNEDRGQEEPSTPILETLAVADQRKTKAAAGGVEELEADGESGTRGDIRCRKMDERVQDGEPESEGATTRKDEETNALLGFTTDEGRNMEHALRSAEGQRTSMHPEEPQRVTGDSGPVEPLRGKYAARHLEVTRATRTPTWRSR